jgi:hypothetical protein
LDTFTIGGGDPIVPYNDVTIKGQVKPKGMVNWILGDQEGQVRLKPVTRRSLRA